MFHRLTILLVAILLLGASAYAAEKQPPAQASYGQKSFLAAPATDGAAIVWGIPVQGLAVGICCDTRATDSLTVPKISFVIENRGTQAVHGAILSGAQCILALNGQFYAQGGFGNGKGSPLPAGKRRGPIPIDTQWLRRISELRVFPTIESDAPAPSLQKGTNTISPCVPGSLHETVSSDTAEG